MSANRTLISDYITPDLAELEWRNTLQRRDDILDIKEKIDTLCRMAMYIPLDEARALVDEINFTDSTMPVIDPTGYRNIAKNIDSHKELAEAFLTFRTKLDKLATGNPS